MSEETTAATTTTADAGAGKDAAYWQNEAKKAFEARDEAKRLAKELSGKVLPDDQINEYQTLKSAQAKAEEERLKKAGEFDNLRKQLVDKHATEVAERDARIKASEDRLRRTVIGLAFAGASDIFGKEALTIYGAKAAERIFADYVDLDEDGSVVVKNRSGNVILDAETGKPASFSGAMKELISSLPDKDDHLRGSGKTGSGSAGGSLTPGHQADLTELTKRAQAGDQEAIKALRQRRASSGALVMGSALAR
jgi:hypothetical protein